MTGYAVATSEGAAGTLTIEIKSVNSRFLDLQFRINDELRALEPDLRAAIMAAITRGKVEARLSFGRKVAGGAQALNGELLADLARLQGEIAQHFAQAQPMTVAELLRWPGVVEEAHIGQESLQADVAALTAKTIAAFVDSRKREGAALETMLQSRIDSMEAIVKRITPLIPQVIAGFQQKAVERMQDALGLAGHGNPSTLTRQEVFERIRQEVTLYGIRIDVSEELSRLSAHLNETRHILKKGGQVGKRLDFMMQELNREANTLGAKASVKELADASMELKLLIEQMREQVQNLE
ncbi:MULTISPECIES: YicC/YloC family endoribonuclease [unclassified Massilia]|uniref:YicC/YloC family endoribonuclease n=1 Tax=unclassified Massilia TaxID=2609279 RepID=UPI00177DABBB|nr:MULTISPECIES: YicC/YloC family endoribonuclease [unclassified Massilia]MBD8528867.1 YicC family protein [Massilia sp. CFBP 13647]MBD8673509.1 YicC family protein [Massilia sp. CFBP 13721]